MGLRFEAVPLYDNRTLLREAAHDTAGLGAGDAVAGRPKAARDCLRLAKRC
jgi:hypothetical protein